MTNFQILLVIAAIAILNVQIAILNVQVARIGSLLKFLQEEHDD